jgi:hypothetical protein
VYDVATNLYPSTGWQELDPEGPVGGLFDLAAHLSEAERAGCDRGPSIGPQTPAYGRGCS